MIHDRIVVGIRDNKLSQKMQLEPDLMLKQVDILISKNQALKMLWLKHHVYKTL